MLYSKLIYPQVLEGDEYTRPEIPESFIENIFCSQTWNIYSSDDRDRTEFWSDPQGTYTEEQVRAELGIVDRKTKVEILP